MKRSHKKFLKNINADIFSSNDDFKSFFILGFDKLILIAVVFFVLIFFMFSTIFSIHSKNQKLFDVGKIISFYIHEPEDKFSKIDKHFKQIQSNFNDNLAGKAKISEIYGGLRKLFGKKTVDDPLPERYVYKGKDGFLYYIAKKDDESIKRASKAITDIHNKLIRKNIDFFTVLVPNKHVISSVLFPEGVMDYTGENTDMLENSLSENGVSILNLSSTFYEEKQDEKKFFYSTDTHWTFDGAYWGYNKILEYLGKRFVIFPENTKYSLDKNSYSKKTYKNISIGSMGKRAGKYYINKKDDVTLLFPKFDTDLVYLKYDENFNPVSEKRGSYKDVFFNKKAIENKDPYTDRYTAIMDYGTGFEIIKNKNIEDKSKIFIIKDSFAMPVASYLSENFENVYLMDIRYPNIKKNMYRIIDTVKPDVVIFMINPSSAWYFPEMFE